MKFKIKKSIEMFLKISLLAIFLAAPLFHIVEAGSSAPENMILINAGGFVRGMDKAPAKKVHKKATNFRYQKMLLRMRVRQE